MAGAVGLIALTDGPAPDTVDLLGVGRYRLQSCGQGDLRWRPGGRAGRPPFAGRLFVTSL